MEPPTVMTAPAASVGQTSAQLNGQLNPNGSSTNYSFQWGTSTAYAGNTSAQLDQQRIGVLALSANITGPSPPSTTYHYRLVGSSFNGTTYGADQTFTTASLPPPPPSLLTGRYHGHTRQRWPITLRVASNQHRLTALTFSFGLRCTNRGHSHLSYSISPLRNGSMWNLNLDAGLGFNHRFTDNQGTRYNVAGTFNTTGTATGTLSAIWKTRQYGLCKTGTVAWSATRTS